MFHARRSACGPRFLRTAITQGLVPALAQLAIAASCAAAVAVETDGPTGAQLEFFEKRIRPLLVTHCVSCHGGQKQESGLRLDSRGAARKGGDRGPALVAGDPAASRLIQAVRYQDPELQMPPGGRLADEAVAALVEWVRQGAPFPGTEPLTGSEAAENARRHWAFQPVRVTAPPGPEGGPDAAAWARSPIDYYILARLRARQLTPSPRADRPTLIRRATADLIGLPPTPEAVEEFLNDETPDAYERLIDRLLASPRYGERWGRHWLDVARYADNKGYVFFEDKNYPWAYTYRDYVVDAMNHDVPYDQFVLQQLAADQLDLGDDKSALCAMGFLTLGGHFMNNTHDIIDDRIDVVTRGLLALTVTCARCHDHKFDPVPQADYYSLYGVFRSCEDPIVPPLFRPEPQTEEYQKYAAELTKRENALSDFVSGKYAELVHGARTRVSEYLMAVYARRGQPPADDFMLLADEGDINPTMILRWQRYLEETPRDDAVWGPWQQLSALDPPAFAASASGILEQCRAVEGGINRLVREALGTAPVPRSIEEVAGRYGELLRRVEESWQEALREAAESRCRPPLRLEEDDLEQLRQALYGEGAPANVPLMMGWGFLSLFPDRPTQEQYKKLLKEVESWSTGAPGAPPRAMVLIDAAKPHEPRVFLRGNPQRLGPRVPRRFLSILATDQDKKLFHQGSGRLELAEAIVSRDNPLTARVIANRVWLHHFGEGLVRTPSDFGTRSEPPSHPELLDYLAAGLVDSDWSLKHLHRQIMLSAVYQQASDIRESCQLADPENRLLWRMNRRRLDFESLRDALLAVSDSLDTRIGGPPLALLGDTLVPRRTIYGYIDRLDVPILLTTFDFPSPASTSAQRSNTTVAPQALYVMNSSFVAEVVKRAQQRLERDVKLAGESPRINRLYRLLFGRQPKPGEMELARRFLGSAPEQAQWQQFIHALLMTNEFSVVD